MADGDASQAKEQGAGKLSTDQIVAGFNKLRQDQTSLTEKILELEADLNEHM